jgi:hypothetical protein
MPKTLQPIVEAPGHTDAGVPETFKVSGPISFEQIGRQKFRLGQDWERIVA